MIETVPIQAPDEQLVVNADAARGKVEVEVLSEAGVPLVGYERGDCVALCDDEVRHVMCWQNRDRLPQNQSVRLRILLQDTQLYSFGTRA